MREDGRWKREEGRGKREEGRGKMEEGRGKREEGRGMMEEGRWKRDDVRWKMCRYCEGTSIIGRTIVRNVVTSQCRKREATEANEGNIRCLRPKHPTIPRETSDLSNQRQVKQVVIL